MRPLAASTGCPGIWADDDGSVIVQGEEVVEPTRLKGGLWTEAQVRIPADLLRRAVLADVLGYLVTIDGKLHAFAPEDVQTQFFAPNCDVTARNGETL